MSWTRQGIIDALQKQVDIDQEAEQDADRGDTRGEIEGDELVDKTDEDRKARQARTRSNKQLIEAYGRRLQDE
jgi:hypothetical protein